MAISIFELALYSNARKGAAILRSPVNIDAMRSIFGQGHMASVLSKIYVQMMTALCRSVPLSSGFRMPAILHACA